MTDRPRTLADYDAFADPDLYLPVRGQRVRIPSPTAREGLRLRRLFCDIDALTPDVERVEARRILGDAWDALDALGADAAIIGLAGRTALLHYGKGPDAAARFWNQEIAPDAKPEAPVPADPGAPGFLGPDDPGGGPIDPVSGLRLWFNPTEMAPVYRVAPTVPWRDIAACWAALELDLHDVYGVDVCSEVLDRRPWRWLELRIRDLLTTPGTRLHTAMFPPKTT
ncbi:DUF7426 family protein [Nocardia sp. NPDC001965]